MIHVDKDKKTIVFYAPKVKTMEPLERREFKLLSCYLCPECKEIIFAYFITDTTKLLELWKYEESKNNTYNNTVEYIEEHKSNYIHFNSGGAQGLQVNQNKNRYSYYCKLCTEELFISTSIKEILNKFKKNEKLDIVIPQYINNNVQLLHERFDFITVIKDVVGIADPIVYIEMPKVHVELNNYEYRNKYGTNYYEIMEKDRKIKEKELACKNKKLLHEMCEYISADTSIDKSLNEAIKAFQHNRLFKD